MQRIANPCTPVRFWYPPPFCARVVELVDTRDLKSLAEKRAGSSPAPGTIYLQRLLVQVKSLRSGCSSAGRASRCQRECHEFESR